MISPCFYIEKSDLRSFFSSLAFLAETEFTEQMVHYHLDTFLVAFILKSVVPKINGPELHLAYYQAGLKFDHVDDRHGRLGQSAPLRLQ